MVYKHKDPAKHDFGIPPFSGTWKQDVRSLSLCGFLGPYFQKPLIEELSLSHIGALFIMHIPQLRAVGSSGHQKVYANLEFPEARWQSGHQIVGSQVPGSPIPFNSGSYFKSYRGPEYD